MPRTLRLLSAAAVLAGTASFSACLEPPISESIEIHMLSGGASIVKVDVTLGDPADYTERPMVLQRLDDERRAIEDRRDTWARRFEAAEPTSEKDVSERKEGRLRHVSRSARLQAVDDLRAFFRGPAIGIGYAEGEGWAELTLTPPKGGGQASTATRERVGRELALLSTRLAEYFAHVRELYGYLEAHQDRARACLTKVLDDLRAKDDLSPDEKRLTAAVADAIDALAAVLDVPEGEADTLDELSRSVFDPFPAPIVVRVSGSILEREGFPGPLAAELRIPTFSLWRAFERLDGRWLAPDPALAIWRAYANGRAVDVSEFAALPRRSSESFSAEEIRAAIEAELRPAPSYRVRWKPAVIDPGDDPFPR